jgi:hypothetical protein
VLIIWGLRSYARLLGIVTLTCGHCHNPAAHRLEEVVRRFTLFFVPLFPVGRKTLMTCTYCGMTSLLLPDQVQHLLTYAHDAPRPPVPGAGPGQPHGSSMNGHPPELPS